MSILSAAEAISPRLLIFLAAASLVSVALLGLAAMFQERDELSLRQLFPRESVGPLFTNAAIAVAMYFFVALMVGALLHARNAAPASADDNGDISPAMLIVLSCVIPLGSLIWILIGLRIIVPNGFHRVGMTVEKFKMAIGPAVGLLAAAFPLIFLASNLSELVYQHFGWHHESAHELLTSMSSVEGVLEKVLAVVAAVVLAPLSEELLFRGHIQGGIRQMFLPHIKRPRFEAAVTQPEAVVASPPDAAIAVIPYASPVLEYTPAVASSKTLMASTVSVVITSMLFAAVHPAWSRAPIFVLSLFLGFAYERRGNLWTNIFMHAMFNGIMVALYLSLPQPPA